MHLAMSTCKYLRCDDEVRQALTIDVGNILFPCGPENPPDQNSKEAEAHISPIARKARFTRYFEEAPILQLEVAKPTKRLFPPHAP